MKKKLPNFKQTTPRAWIWFILIGIHVLSAIYAALHGVWGAAVVNLIVALGIYWIDQLEKELTRRNIEDDRTAQREGLQ